MISGSRAEDEASESRPPRASRNKRWRRSLLARLSRSELDEPEADPSDVLQAFATTEENIARRFPEAKPSADGIALLDDLAEARVHYTKKVASTDIWRRRAMVAVKFASALGVLVAAAALAHALSLW